MSFERLLLLIFLHFGCRTISFPAQSESVGACIHVVDGKMASCADLKAKANCNAQDQVFVGLSDSAGRCQDSFAFGMTYDPHVEESFTLLGAKLTPVPEGLEIREVESQGPLGRLKIKHDWQFKERQFKKGDFCKAVSGDRLAKIYLANIKNQELFAEELPDGSNFQGVESADLPSLASLKYQLKKARERNLRIYLKLIDHESKEPLFLEMEL